MKEFVVGRARKAHIADCVKRGGHYLDNQGCCHRCGILMDEFLYRLTKGKPSTDMIREASEVSKIETPTLESLVNRCIQ